MSERRIKEWSWLIVVSLWGYMLCKPIWQWAAQVIRDVITR